MTTEIEGVKKYQFAMGPSYREQVVDSDGNHRTVVKADLSPMVVYQDLNKSQVLALEHFFSSDAVMLAAWAEYQRAAIPRLIELGVRYADFKGELPNLPQTRELMKAAE